ncbi:MAG: hypothetical protein OHK006_22260 [Thermodesulfovibrionales bacterium]
MTDPSPITHHASRKAIALYSGGLDSTLAILTVMKQGIEVKAVTFMNHFGCDISDRSSCSKNPFAAAQQFGFEVKLCHLSDKFVQIVKSPKFGHGRNMNPCVDCRILMLTEAKVFMEMTGADFIITGEVLGQRPMSQRRDSLDIIDREAGLKGRVLRPLSAKLLRPTRMEEEGIVNRELLHGFGGRTRKPQMALAAEYGLTEYPAPAGGCLLTEPNYSFRLRELLDHEPDPSTDDFHLLRLGRHFRMGRGCRLIVGRDRSENEALFAFAGASVWMRVEGYGSPVALIRGAADGETIRTAASICARYSDAKHLQAAKVRVVEGEKISFIDVVPANEDLIGRYKVEKKKKEEAAVRA